MNHRIRIVVTDPLEGAARVDYVGNDAGLAALAFDGAANDPKNEVVRMFIYPTPSKRRFPSKELKPLVEPAAEIEEPGNTASAPDAGEVSVPGEPETKLAGETVPEVGTNEPTETAAFFAPPIDNQEPTTQPEPIEANQPVSVEVKEAKPAPAKSKAEKRAEAAAAARAKAGK